MKQPFVVTEVWGQKNYYYILQQISHNNSSDFEISCLLHMVKEEYQKIMVEKFNGFTRNNETYFKNKEDAKKAIEWLEDRYLIYYLAGQVTE